MHLNSEEALAIIDEWKYKQTPLQLQLPGAPAGTRTSATIWTRLGTKVTLQSETNQNIEVDLAGADFNGDGKTIGSALGAYLICEFGDDRVEFYGPPVKGLK
jgi:hypothetical protein